MKISLFILSILPVFLIGGYIYNKDKNKEPLKLVLKLLLSGILSVILTLIITLIFEIFIPMFRLETNQLNAVQLLIYILVKVALVEEFSKWIMVYKISFHDTNFDEIYDMIIYSVFVTLGFAGLENISYVYEKGLITALLRMVISVPGHACFGIFMGYYLGLTKMSNLNNNKELTQKNILLSIIIPTLLHTIFDYLLFLSNNVNNYLISYIIIVIFIIFIIILFIKSFKKINKISSITEPIFFKNKYCTECGKEIKSEFCIQCGKRVK